MTEEQAREAASEMERTWQSFLTLPYRSKSEYKALLMGWRAALEYANRWTYLPELPDEEDDYLVQYGFNDDTGPFISTAEFFPDGDDPAGWLIHRTSSESAEVIAWRLLPKVAEIKRSEDDV